MNKNIYDLITAIIPSLIIGAISLVSIIYSNRKQKIDQLSSIKLNKVETLYEKLIIINRTIIEEKSKYVNNLTYYISENICNKILKEIDLLKIESQLYFGIISIDILRKYAQKFINQMKSNDAENYEKNNLKDGEYDEDDKGNKIEIHPCTFIMCYNEYENMYDEIENIIIRIAQIEIGIKIKTMKIKNIKKYIKKK